jgi:periplasmic copper chaperone A
MRSKIVTLALLAALSAGPAGAHEVTVKGVTVAHPWARAMPGGATVGSAFAEIKTDKDTSDRLVGVSSPIAKSAEVHSMTMDGNVMKMRRLDGIDLKPGESHILKPMAEHIMLFGLTEPLKEGDLVKLTFTFEKAGPIEVEGTVEPPGAMGPHGLDHQPGDDSMTNSMSHDQMHGEMQK